MSITMKLYTNKNLLMKEKSEAFYVIFIFVCVSVIVSRKANKDFFMELYKLEST